MKKKTRLTIVLNISISMLFFMGCSKNNITKQIDVERDIQKHQEQEIEESEIDEIEKYQGGIIKFSFLERDGLFHLKLADGENVIVDSNGKIQDPLSLNSDYLYCTGEVTSDNKQIFDLFDNNVQERFIKDSAHEKILGICKMDTKDVIWVWESQETPMSSLFIIKGFDEKGTELCRIESSNQSFSEGKAELFKYITHVQYTGDTTCEILYTQTNYNGLFIINVETGEILEPNKLFSEGYATASNKIVDVHGNIIHSFSDSSFSKLADYNEGVFFNAITKKFYDINLNEVIDLSNYDLVYWGNEWIEDYVFEDGYCGIEAKNESGTRFFGVIDLNGNWVVEMTDIRSGMFDTYDGKVTDTIIRLENKLYNIETGEIKDCPSYLTGAILHENKYYYLDEDNHSIYSYDPQSGQSMMLGDSEA